MNHDDIERLLIRLTPCGAAPELRARVLAAVSAELQSTPRRWWSVAVLAVAASIVLALGLNLWLSRRFERRLAALLGPPPVSKQAAEVARAVAQATDAATGRWVYQRLAPVRSSGDSIAKHYPFLRRLVEELQTTSKDSIHETLEEGPQMDRDHSGRARRGAAGGQRLVRWDVRLAA
ncbi:MAG: hypothetical protein NUV77_00950 [Thermoguttaceae bacterium]|nr:hypothetical protein [Thermoguttaceae bacterium]